MGECYLVVAEVLQVEAGSLYPALHRLEHRSWISAAWGVVQMSSEIYTTVSLVDAGIGVTIIPATMTAMRTATSMGWKGVRYCPIRSKLAVTRIAAAWRRDNVNPTLAGFMDIARSVAASVRH